MKLFFHILLIGGLLVLNAYANKASSGDYVGDGNLIHLKKPGLFGSDGWRVVFDEFPLSKEFNRTYVFTELPEVKKLNYYVAYLYIPPSLHKAAFNKVVLHMSLYAEGTLLSEFSAPMCDWICTECYLKSGRNAGGDGAEKSFYHRTIKIPAGLKSKCELKVHYAPPSAAAIEGNGYFYLQIGGSK